jgi:peptidoglycan/LPS O-acetylase OafA/YrhL
MVFVYHLPWLAGFRDKGALAHGELLSGLDAGVGLFFTLSAFLLSRPFWRRIYENKSNANSLEPFLVRRCSRIFPAYLIVVGLSLLFDERTWTGWGLVNLALHVTGLQTHFHQNFVWLINNVLWTVSIELQFYLFLALIFWTGERIPRLKGMNGAGLLVLITLFVFGSNPLYRAALVTLAPQLPHEVFGGGDLNSSVYTWNIFYFLKWFWPGILAAWLEANTQLYRSQGISVAWQSLIEVAIPTLVAAAALMVGNSDEGDWRKYLVNGWPLNICVFSGVVLLAPLSRVSNFLLGNRLLVFFGTISYGLYLWHYPVLKAVGKGSLAVYSDGWTRVCLVGATGLAVTSFLAFLSYKLVEEPITARTSSSFRALYAKLFSEPLHARRPGIEVQKL